MAPPTFASDECFTSSAMLLTLLSKAISAGSSFAFSLFLLCKLHGFPLVLLVFDSQILALHRLNFCRMYFPFQFHTPQKFLDPKIPCFRFRKRHFLLVRLRRNQGSRQQVFLQSFDVVTPNFLFGFK